MQRARLRRAAGIWMALVAAGLGMILWQIGRGHGNLWLIRRVALLGAGGIFYTIGTQFYRRKEMAYRYPIWHSFGTCGGLSFFAAIWIAVVS